MVELKQNPKNCGYGFKIIVDGTQAGIIEYKDFWDGMPYLSLIRILPEYRRKGIGTQAIRILENNLKNQGGKALLTSTQSNEQAQHFYRKLGFCECGCLILENTPLAQPMELFFIKVLADS